MFCYILATMMWTVGMADGDPESNRYPRNVQRSASESDRRGAEHGNAARALNGAGSGEAHRPRQLQQQEEPAERMKAFCFKYQTYDLSYIINPAFNWIFCYFQWK